MASLKERVLYGLLKLVGLPGGPGPGTLQVDAQGNVIVGGGAGGIGGGPLTLNVVPTASGPMSIVDSVIQGAAASAPLTPPPGVNVVAMFGHRTYIEQSHTTTDGLPFDLINTPIPIGLNELAEFDLVASDGVDSCAWKFFFKVTCVAGPVATVTPMLVLGPSPTAGAVGWSAALAAVGGNVRLRIVGANGVLFVVSGFATLDF